MKKLKYTWQINSATQDDPDDYFPKAVDIEYADSDQLIKDIAVSGSILKETELRAVTLRVFQQLTKYIGEGQGFRNEYITVKPVLRGNARDGEEPWDDEKHEKYASALLGKPCQEAAAGMELQLVPRVKKRQLSNPSMTGSQTPPTTDSRPVIP